MTKQDERLYKMRALIAGRHRISPEHMLKLIDDLAVTFTDLDHDASKGELPADWSK